MSLQLDSRSQVATNFSRSNLGSSGSVTTMEWKRSAVGQHLAIQEDVGEAVGNWEV